MMGVLEENIYEIRDASKKDMENLMNKIYEFIKPRTRPLKENTGICDKYHIRGFPWSRVKIRAMMKDANDDYVIVSHFCSLTFCID